MKFKYHSSRIAILLIMFAVFFSINTWAVEQNSSIEIPYLKTGDKVVKHTGYSLLYSESDEQARWVAYILTKDHVESNNAQRESSSFISDPKITSGSASTKDYTKSGYDRGHLCPAADNKWSIQAMSDCFYMSNMSPQTPSLNRGIWKTLEERVRDVAISYGKAYIVTAGVLDNKYKGHIGIDNVSVPSYYYKVILLEKPYRSIGFIIPNTTSFGQLSDYACSIDNVEKVTGIDFYPAIPDSIESRLESNYDPLLFKFITSSTSYTKPKNTSSMKIDNSIQPQDNSKPTGKYWITSTGKRHNSSCRYYGTTNTGYYTNEKKGVACKICGG